MIQVLMSLGLMSIVTYTSSSMIHNLQRQNSQITQKLAALDIQRNLTSLFADSSNICNFMVANRAPQTFNPTTVGSSSPPSISFAEIPSKGLAGAPPAFAVSGTVPASHLSNQLIVSSIALKDFECIPSPCTADTAQFRANMTVEFDPSNLVIGLMPLKIPVTLASVGLPGSKVLSSCQGETSAGGGSVPSGTTCGNRFVAIAGGGTAITYDRDNWGTTSPSIPCAGSILTASTATPNNLESVSGCPSGFSGQWTLTGKEAAAPFDRYVRIFCVAN